jgi:UDP-N-acetyl-D-mannosaminuronate dehydrogenase
LKCTTIAIIGIGYAGLPLSFQFARSETRVLGLDIDASKVKALMARRSYIKLESTTYPGTTEEDLLV